MENPLFDIARKAAQQSDFEALDKAGVKKWSDKELATWQSAFTPGSPQSLFAEQQWRYRLSLYSAKYAALIAIVSAIVGAVAGYSLRYVQEVSDYKPKTEKHQNQTPPAQPKINK